MTVDAVAWRGLDLPGGDTCRLGPGSCGWRFDGAPAVRPDGTPARLAYQVRNVSVTRAAKA